MAYYPYTPLVERMLQALEQAEARAEKAGADAREWKEQIPEECPITGLPYFNSFKNSAGVYQPFYGGPCDVYGIPYQDEDGYLCRKHLCLDSMRDEDENMCLQVVEEERMIDLGEAEAKVARLIMVSKALARKLAQATRTWGKAGNMDNSAGYWLAWAEHDADAEIKAARRAVEGK